MPSKVDDTIDFDEEPPTSINPYAVLDIAEDASDDQVKKAYRKAALKNHPDKAQDADRDNAKEKFQEIAFAYAILNEPRRRKRYDSTGSTAETLDIDDDDFDWLTFFREQWFEAITPDLLERDKQEFRDSGEERTALLKAYTKSKGNMDHIHSEVMHSNILDDDVRFRQMLDEAIANGEVEPFERYTNETEKSKQNRVKRAQREAKEAGEAKVEIDDKAKQKSARKSRNDKTDEAGGDLAALIQKRQAARSNGQSQFFEHLEEKYGEEGGSRGKKRDEPSEEAFAEMGKRLKKSKSDR